MIVIVSKSEQLFDPNFEDICTYDDGTNDIKVIDDATEAYKYAANRYLHTLNRWPEGENLIKTDPRLVYEYAKNIIQGRWPEGEKTLIHNRTYAYLYVVHIISNKWHESEQARKSDPYWAYLYATYVVKGRYPAGEDIMRTNKIIYTQYLNNLNNMKVNIG